MVSSSAGAAPRGTLTSSTSVALPRAGTSMPPRKVAVAARVLRMKREPSRPESLKPTALGLRTSRLRRKSAVPSPMPGGSIRTKPDLAASRAKVGTDSTLAVGTQAPSRAPRIRTVASSDQRRDRRPLPPGLKSVLFTQLLQGDVKAPPLRMYVKSSFETGQELRRAEPLGRRWP